MSELNLHIWYLVVHEVSLNELTPQIHDKHLFAKSIKS